MDRFTRKLVLCLIVILPVIRIILIFCGYTPINTKAQIYSYMVIYFILVIVFFIINKELSFIIKSSIGILAIMYIIGVYLFNIAGNQYYTIYNSPNNKNTLISIRETNGWTDHGDVYIYKKINFFLKRKIEGVVIPNNQHNSYFISWEDDSNIIISGDAIKVLVENPLIYPNKLSSNSHIVGDELHVNVD